MRARCRKELLLIAVATAALGLSGCGHKTEVQTRSTTTGQELQDLDAAHDKGLISDAEYKKQRKRILNGD